MEKTCIDCKETKPLTDFHRKKGEKRKPRCRDCENARVRKRYHADARYRKRRTAKVAANVKARVNRMKAKIDVLKDVPCADCGQKWPPVAMDFDHRDPKAKRENVCTMVNDGLAWKTIKAEIDKCDVVCACCHRLRSWGGSSAAERRSDESVDGGSSPSRPT
jgi:hypothetical protein